MRSAAVGALIVRGKQAKAVEFGAKLGLLLVHGYLTGQTLRWDAYDEAADLQKQAQAYRLLFGHWPKLIQADKKYATNANRSWCKKKGIRLTVRPKGRPPKKTARQKRKERGEYAERNATPLKGASVIPNRPTRLITPSQAAPDLRSLDWAYPFCNELVGLCCQSKRNFLRKP